LEECDGLLKPYIEHISQYDDGVFTDDCEVGPRYLLPHMNFREIWELIDSEDFQDEIKTKTKKAIYNHLQTIYVSIQMALNQINVFNKNIEKQKTFLMDMLENLQMDEKIKERIEEMKREEKENDKGGGFSLGKLGDMFGEDNFVFQLAKDVAEELEMGSDDIDNPVEAITQLFANGGQRLQELIVTVGDKIEQKIESGEIDKDKMIQEAGAMKDKLEGLMGKIPGLENMMNGNGMIDKFKDAYDNLEEDEKQHFNYIPNILGKNLLEWNEDDKKRFEEFTKYTNPNTDTNTDTNTNPKPKPKAKKSKSRN